MRIQDPAFTIAMDDRCIIHVRAEGLWCPQVATRYWSAFLPFLAESRRCLGHAKVLIDRRGAPVMPPEMVQHMRLGIMNHYHADDRLALVFDTSPLKSQARQNYPLEHLDAFLSYDAALAWLQNS